MEKVKVEVINIKMPFFSMVIFMIKWALAAIPAMFILIVIFMIIAGICRSPTTATIAF